MSRVYLGDSVYAEFEQSTGMVKLYTDNGFGPNNIIWLEPEVIAALKSYIEIVLEGPLAANDQ